MLQHCTCKTFGHVSSTWPVSLVFLERVKFAAHAPVIVLCMLWDHQVHPEHLGFLHYTQSHGIGMQGNQNLRELQGDVCNPCCVHAHSRHEHKGFSRCWGYKHGYLLSPGAEHAFSAKGSKALLLGKHYKPVPLPPVFLFFIVSSRLTWCFLTGRHHWSSL